MEMKGPHKTYVRSIGSRLSRFTRASETCSRILKNTNVEIEPNKTQNQRDAKHKSDLTHTLRAKMGIRIKKIPAAERAALNKREQAMDPSSLETDTRGKPSRSNRDKQARKAKSLSKRNAQRQKARAELAAKSVADVDRVFSIKEETKSNDKRTFGNGFAKTIKVSRCN